MVNPVGDYLITAAHAGYDKAIRTNPVCVIREEGQYDTCLVEIRDYVTMQTFRQKVRVLYVQQTLDYDVMLLEKPAGLTSYRMDLLVKPVLGKKCHIQVMDKKKAGTHGKGTIGAAAVLGSPHLKHTANTSEGDSGSLVWSGDEIVGIHGGELSSVSSNYFVPTNVIRVAIEECNVKRVSVNETYFC